MEESNVPEVTPPAAAEPRAAVFPQIFAGIALGLLLGLIAGLSVSPVVQTILGALVAVVAGFLGVQSTGALPAGLGNVGANMRANEWRIGSFSLACIAGIVIGLYVRTNQPFVSLPAHIAKWKAAGYTEERAQDLVAFQQLGLVPAGRTVQSGATQTAASGALMAKSTRVKLCDELNPAQYGTPQYLLDAYRLQDSKKLSALADEIQSHVPAQNQKALLQANWEVVCEIENSKTETPKAEDPK